MVSNESLSQRIKAEFESSASRAKAAEQEKIKQRQEQEARLVNFNKVCDELKEVWRPRVEEFAKQFGDKVKVTPSLSPSLREVKVDFLTDLANVAVVLSVSPNADVTSLVLDYNLQIIPMFFDYERNARVEMPLNKIDKAALGKWIDDRLVSCVKAYLSLNENEFYLKRQTVEDPISKRRLLKDHAVASIEKDGKTYYFATKDSYQQFLDANKPGKAMAGAT